MQASSADLLVRACCISILQYIGFVQLHRQGSKLFMPSLDCHTLLAAAAGEQHNMQYSFQLFAVIHCSGIAQLQAAAAAAATAAAAAAATAAAAAAAAAAATAAACCLHMTDEVDRPDAVTLYVQTYFCLCCQMFGFAVCR